MHVIARVCSNFSALFIFISGRRCRKLSNKDIPGLLSLNALTLIFALSKYNLTASNIWAFDLGKLRFAILIAPFGKPGIKEAPNIVLLCLEILSGYSRKKKDKQCHTSQWSKLYIFKIKKNISKAITNWTP